MKYASLRHFALLAAVAVMTTAASQPRALDVTELTLSNGLTVWLNEDHSQPKVYGALVVKAGAKDCPNTGIAHYLEHVLFKGTQRIGTIDYAAEQVWLDSISQKYNELSQTTDAARRLSLQQDISRLSQRAADYAIPNEFDRLISKYGGSALNASTSYDVTEYHNTFTPQFLEQWCWLNSERMLNPVFRLFQGELETVYEEKNRASDNMLTPVVERVMEAAFREHPYQYPIIGSTENLKNPRLSDMEAFFHKYYVAGNMGLMLSGDFQAEGIEPLLERTFGRLPRGEVVRQKTAALEPLSGETLDLKVNIPIMKAVGLLFRGPLDEAPDFRALQIAMRLLCNENGTGMLDSLRTAHKVTYALGENFSMNEAGAVGLLVIPKIPFGSKKKAERLCWEQIERVRQGRFSDERLELARQDLLRDIEEGMETITNRAMLMGDVFSRGRTWEDYLAQAESVRRITKADVMAAACRYLKDDAYLRGVKKFGSYPKEKVSQPNYKPVVPPHAREQSAFAKQLELLPVADRAPRLIDLAHDAQIVRDEAFTLYRVDNPVNDLFSLSLKWLMGERQAPRQQLLEAYIDELGTDSLTKHQLGEAWQRLGTTFTTQSSDNYFMLTLHGFEHNLEPSLKLLRHMLTRLKPDREATKAMRNEYRMSRKQMGRENQDVFQMVLQKIMVGDKSSYLRMPTVQEVKQLGGDDLLRLFDQVRQYPCDVLYSGKQSAERVAALCRQYLPVPEERHPAPDNAHRLQEYQEPVVYLYDMPDTRQTYVGVFGNVKPNLTDREEALLRLWSQYMGGGMSSLLFQEIREFRSMAYSTGGQDIIPNRARHADHSSGYLAYLGTQGDKAMQALAVLDSLLTQMPVNELNVASARQEVLNNINNGYPSFRQLPNYVSTYHMNGYTEDPRISIARIVPSLTAADITSFYREHIQPRPRVVFIIGNKHQLDLQQLSRYGRIIELKKTDIMR
ncbi:MAG: insulinase family protein [Prevotella sp.]|nr:insulinase family protein [Prevotella sp.]